MTAELRRIVGVDDEGVGWPALGGAAPGGIFGGQLVALAVSAAARSAPPGCVPDSATVHLLGGSRTDAPVALAVTPVRNGRSLQVHEVRGEQDGRVVVLATVVSAAPHGRADWQSVGMPAAPPPDPTSRPLLRVLEAGVFEIAAPVGHAATHPLWVRCREEVEDDAWLHGAAVAYWSDFGMNFAARARHEAVHGPATGVSATHSLTVHRRSPLHEWHLFDVEVRSLAAGQGFAHGSLFHASGALVASVAQRAFLRAAP